MNYLPTQGVWAFVVTGIAPDWVQTTKNGELSHYLWLMLRDCWNARWARACGEYHTPAGWLCWCSHTGAPVRFCRVPANRSTTRAGGRYFHHASPILRSSWSLSINQVVQTPSSTTAAGGVRGVGHVARWYWGRPLKR
jgi:hypothetical protein